VDQLDVLVGGRSLGADHVSVTNLVPPLHRGDSERRIRFLGHKARRSGTCLDGLLDFLKLLAPLLFEFLENVRHWRKLLGLLSFRSSPMEKRLDLFVGRQERDPKQVNDKHCEACDHDDHGD